MSTLPSLWASILARQVAAGLLKGVAVPGEIDATQRGMPYNVTTEMDLKLWSIAAKGEQSAFRRVGRLSTGQRSQDRSRCPVRMRRS